jgi:hypothetical protein
MEYDKRVIIRFLCKDGIPADDIHKQLEAHFGENGSSLRSGRWRCQYVLQGSEDLHDEVQSGRPTIDFLDVRILALSDEKSFYSANPIADALPGSDSAILNHLRESLGMKILGFCWIRYQLRGIGCSTLR